MARGKPKILVVGAGIAGSLIAAGLYQRDDVELICLERSPRGGQLDGGTGLNVGPNAIRTLSAFRPDWAETLKANSRPWRRWTIGLTDGQALMDLPLDEVADNPGIRIRWAELYGLLRQPLGAVIRYGTELVRCERTGERYAAIIRDLASGEETRLDGVDFVVAADGRYSATRESFDVRETPSFLGVCLYRLLIKVGPDCPIDDYGQWFNGPNRLLAFTVPGDFIYIAGSFPIATHAETPEEMKQPDALRAAYTPGAGQLSTEASFLVDAVTSNAGRIHWARLQDGNVRYGGPRGVLFVGDAAHPMVPTLGQGATQSIEDACVAVEEIGLALDGLSDLTDISARIEARRAERVRFVVDFSREASDTMLAGADPVAGTMRKTQPDFRSRLERLYRDTPVPVR